MNCLLTECTKLVKVKDQQAAGTTDVPSDSVDMAADGGWDGVVFFTSYGTAAANNAIHAEQSGDDGSSDAFADLEASEVDLTSGKLEEDQFIDIFRPTERYVRCVGLRGTSSTLGDIWAMLYRGRTVPHSNAVSDTQAGKQLISPAEGTK